MQGLFKLWSPRVEELEKKIVSLENQIEFLQAQNEVARQAMFNKY